MLAQANRRLQTRMRQRSEGGGGASTSTPQISPRGRGGGGGGGGGGLGDALNELASRSPYMQAIQSDVEDYGPDLRNLAREIASFKTDDMKALVSFRARVDDLLDSLTDEGKVLAQAFPDGDWPSGKVEAIRVAASVHERLEAARERLDGLKDFGSANASAPPAPGQSPTAKVQAALDMAREAVESWDKEEDASIKRFAGVGVAFPRNAGSAVKLAASKAAARWLTAATGVARAARSEHNVLDMSEMPESVGRALKRVASHAWDAWQFAYRVYTFAGGASEDMESASAAAAEELEQWPSAFF